MSVWSSEEICSLFKQFMAEGDIDSVLSIHDPKVVFLSQSGETKEGWQELKQELAPFADAKARFDFSIIQFIRSGDIALHTEWEISWPQQTSLYANRSRQLADGRHMALAHR